MDFVTYAIILAVTSVISYLTRPKPPKPDPATLSDLEIPNIEEGRAFRVIFGTVLVKAPAVAAVGGFERVAIKSKSGKK